jgi:hypothetical protein
MAINDFYCGDRWRCPNYSIFCLLVGGGNHFQLKIVYCDINASSTPREILDLLPNYHNKVTLYHCRDALVCFQNDLGLNLNGGEICMVG